MKYPDYLDLAEYHARRWYEDHGLPHGPMLCVCAGEKGLFTRDAYCGTDSLDRAALRRELRAEYAGSGVTQAFYLSVAQGNADGIAFGPALLVVTYEKDKPDRGRVILLQADPVLGARGWTTPPDQVTSPFPELLTGLDQN